MNFFSKETLPFLFLCLFLSAIGIFLIIHSIRAKKKKEALFGVIAIGISGLLVFVASGASATAIESCIASCEANGITVREYLGIPFMIIGACGLIADLLLSIRSSKKYITPVEATCIDEAGPVFQITLYGKQHTLTRKIHYSRHGYHAKIGEVKTLYIDENDLNGFYDPKEDKANRIGLRISVAIVFSIFLLMGVLIYFVGR